MFFNLLLEQSMEPYLNYLTAMCAQGAVTVLCFVRFYASCSSPSVCLYVLSLKKSKRSERNLKGWILRRPETPQFYHYFKIPLSLVATGSVAPAHGFDSYLFLVKMLCTAIKRSNSKGNFWGYILSSECSPQKHLMNTSPLVCAAIY